MEVVVLNLQCMPPSARDSELVAELYLDQGRWQKEHSSKSADAHVRPGYPTGECQILLQC